MIKNNNMKTKYLKLMLSILFLMFSAVLSAQTIKDGQYKVNNHTYNISKIAKEGHKQVLIKEKDEWQNQERSGDSTWTYSYLNLADPESIKSVFVKVLGAKRIKELIPGKYVALSMYVNTEGHILKINYYLESNSALTLKEIDDITTALKRKVTFQVPSTTKKGARLLPFMYIVRFNTLVN